MTGRRKMRRDVVPVVTVSSIGVNFEPPVASERFDTLVDASGSSPERTPSGMGARIAARGAAGAGAGAGADVGAGVGAGLAQLAVKS